MHKLLLCLAALAAPLRAQDSWNASLPKALAEAKASNKRVLADFTAPWCYSCYYMEKNVFSHAAFWEAARGLVLVRVDVDQPAGLALKNDRRVRFLPTFLVLDAGGRELGRIVGEQREADFLARLKALTKPAAASPKDGAAAKLEALRLSLRKKPSIAALDSLLRAADDCDFADDLTNALKASLPKPALAELRPRLEAWAERRYWVPLGDRCADFRGGVEALAGYYERLGEPAARTDLLERAVAVSAAVSERASLGQDRNLDDDRRFFLEAAGKDGDIEQLYPRLIQAYPADYVYAYRFAKWLSGKGRAAEALPWIEKADRLCYGANRLSVTKVRAETLRALGRRAEAAALLRRDIKAYRETFPKETRPLQDLLASFDGKKAAHP